MWCSLINSCIILQEMTSLLSIHSFWHRKPINTRTPRVVQITVSWLLLKMLNALENPFVRSALISYIDTPKRVFFPTDFKMKTRTYLILFAFFFVFLFFFFCFFFFVSLISRNCWQLRIMFQCKLRRTWAILHKLHRYNYLLLRNCLRTRLIFPTTIRYTHGSKFSLQENQFSEFPTLQD